MINIRKEKELSAVRTNTQEEYPVTVWGWRNRECSLLNEAGEVMGKRIIQYPDCA